MSLLDRMLGRPTKKESAVGSLLSLFTVGRAAPTPRDYENVAREAYARNIIAYRCIALVAEAAAGIPFTLYRGTTEVATHPLLDLFDRPNPMEDGVSWRQALYSYDLLAGNTYTEKAQAGSTIELYVHRPDRMRVVPGAAGWPEAYEFRIKGREKRWDVDPISGASPILHVKHFNPLDDWYGQPPLEAAAYDVDQHNASRKWNLSLLQNGARPSGALVYRPDEGENVLPEEEFNRLKAQLEDQGARKAGKPMLLDGGLDWVQMMLSQTDMDWLGGLDKAASYIAQAFNVPEQLVGVPGQQTYNNYKEARQALYEDAVLPLAHRYAAAFTEWLVEPELGPRYYLAINEDEVPALASRKEQQYERLNSTRFLTINEKREAIGYPPVEGGDVIFVGASELPLSFAAEPPLIPTEPSEDEPDEDDDIDLSVEQAAQAAYGTK